MLAMPALLGASVVACGALLVPRPLSCEGVAAQLGQPMKAMLGGVGQATTPRVLHDGSETGPQGRVRKKTVPVPILLIHFRFLAVPVPGDSVLAVPVSILYSNADTPGTAETKTYSYNNGSA